MKGAERRGFAMTAVPSNADVKKAGLEVFAHALGMSAFVELGRQPPRVSAELKYVSQFRKYLMQDSAQKLGC